MTLEKRLGILVSLILYVVTGLLLVAALGGALTHRPLLLTAIRSGSMYPTLERGDAVLISRVGKNSSLKPGDIIVFNSESGSLASQGWVMHRIVSGNSESGYITKGDNNDKTDQDNGGAPPIKHDWVVSRALSVGQSPIKIPLVGYLPLWLEQLQKNPLLLPGIAATLAVIVGLDELLGKKKKRNKRLEQQLLYFFSGLTLAVILAGSTLATSQQLCFEYEVSPTNKGVIMGSPVGILQTGEVVERPLSELKNSGFFPIIASVTTADQQFTFDRTLIRLLPGRTENITLTVTASEPGKHTATVWVGMFLPLLPAALIHHLAQTSFWLALAVTSLIPSLPLMLLPVLDPRLRRRSNKEVRRIIRRLIHLLPVPF